MSKESNLGNLDLPRSSGKFVDHIQGGLVHESIVIQRKRNISIDLTNLGCIQDLGPSHSIYYILHSMPTRCGGTDSSLYDSLSSSYLSYPGGSACIPPTMVCVSSPVGDKQPTTH